VFTNFFLVKLQAKSLDKELTLFYPCHNKDNNKNKNPSPKSIRRGVLESWNLTHRPIMGFWLSLGVQMTHVTRRTRRTTPKSTITEHTKNLIVAPKILSDPKFFQNQYFFQTQIFFDTKFFRTKFLFGPKTLFCQKKISDLTFFSGPKLFSGHIFFSDTRFCPTQKNFQTQNFF